MYRCLWLTYTRRDWFNEWKKEKRHKFTNMGKLKRLELWWQLYVTWLPVRDLDNFKLLDFCWTEGTYVGCVTEVSSKWIVQYWQRLWYSFFGNEATSVGNWFPTFRGNVIVSSSTFRRLKMRPLHCLEKLGAGYFHIMSSVPPVIFGLLCQILKV
jgi:hypothetical protein